jgi:S-adenosylmethionine synthetase
MSYLFTSESVSEGHPDKVADQISDALLDAFLAQDAASKVACETLVTTGLAVLSGEVKSTAYVDVQKVARDTIRRIGYTRSEYMFDADSCGVISAIHEQSPDINQGVEKARPEEQGAGDQGMMFGYATNETDSFMPLPLEISHIILRELAVLRRESRPMRYLRPDAKSQVTVRYSEKHKPEAIDTIVISTQHDPFIHTGHESSDQKAMQEQITADIHRYLMPRVLKRLPMKVRRLFTEDVKYFINPTGNFVIGGPHGDTGLTGRKIIVDTYGGKGAHGGGAFSGKDPSKVDRSAAYAARHIAKNLVASDVASQVLVQVAYAIGVAEPVGLYVNTYGTAKVRDKEGRKLSDSEIARRVSEIFDMRPGMLIKRLKLQQPIYAETAAYGHMGRRPQVVNKTISWGNQPDNQKTVQVELFTWEKLDFIGEIRKAFNS